MRGSLHCAVHDETVNSFGRDDALVGVQDVGARDDVLVGVQDVGGRDDALVDGRDVELWGTLH